MNSVTSRLSKLNPFSRSNTLDDEELGEATDANTMAGGGHAGRETDITLHRLRISGALRAFLVDKQVLSESQAGLEDLEEMTEELHALLDKPHIKVPPEMTDRSHPLPDYFISSSHNTYLMAHQLYGSSSATAYETALKAGARCVEIDAWDGSNLDEPEVTHGYTLTSNIAFRSVCETIRDVVDHEAAEAVNEQGYRAAPIVLSLENHCDAHGQLRLVEIMKEVFGDRLLSKAVRDKGTREQEGTGEHVSLAELGSKIAVIVEYHFPGEPEDSDDDDSSSSEDEDSKLARREYKQKKQAAPAIIIIPELAELGIYAQSVKPPNNLWYEVGQLDDSPHHPLINVSETGLLAHMPANNAAIARHNSNHLMRVYPKGTRISSKNLAPVPFWGIGAQICALNWQTFGASMQLNEALFSGTDGYVLKPASLRGGKTLEEAEAEAADSTGTTQHSRVRLRLRLHIAGATDIPLPAGRDPSDIKPYLTCTLVRPSDHTTPTSTPKRKTRPYKQHTHLSTSALSFLNPDKHANPALTNPEPTSPIWNETLSWGGPEDPPDASITRADYELGFLRLLVKSDDSFATNPKLVVAAVRLACVVKGEWVFIRMLNLKGHETACGLLVRFEVDEVC